MGISKSQLLMKPLMFLLINNWEVFAQKILPNVAKRRPKPPGWSPGLWAVLWASHILGESPSNRARSSARSQHLTLS